MKAMKPKIVFFFLVLMGCMPSTGYADTLQGAIDESLIVPLAKLEARANLAADYAEYETVREGRKATLDEYMAVPLEDKYKAKRETAWEKYKAASAKEKALKIAAIAVRDATDAAIADAKAKAQQGKQRARHCRATLKPVDDHLEIVKIVECVQTLEAISDACTTTSDQFRHLAEAVVRGRADASTTATDQFRQDKKLKVSIDTEVDSLKAYVTQCIRENITGYSALVRYIVTSKAKDQYAGLIEKCRQEETNTLGVLGYEFIWPCFKSYLDMIDEPLEPAPTEISPEPTEESETLPKVKA